MGKPTQQQKSEDLKDQIFAEKTKRVSAEIAEILKREGLAFQPYLHFAEAGLIPMVRYVERPSNPQSNANGKTETPSQSDG